MGKMNNVSFQKGQSGNGAPLTGTDYISGLLFYNNTAPAAFQASPHTKLCLSLAQAEGYGILNDFSDETPAVGSVAIASVVSVTGDKISIYFTEPDGTVVLLGSYTPTVGQDEVAIVAALIVNINSLTFQHGYAAVINGLSTAKLDIEARPGLGIFPNSGTPLSHVTTGTIVPTITQMSGGVYSKLAIYHYHIDRYFKRNPQGRLWVGIFAVPATFDYVEIATMQNAASNEINHIGIYVNETDSWATADIDLIQGVLDALELVYKTISSAIYVADATGLTLSGDFVLPAYNLATLTDKNVSASLMQDGAAEGYILGLTCGVSIGSVGADLGAISFSKVSESIAWVEKQRVDFDGVEFNTLAFITGEDYKTIQNLTPLTPDVVFDALNDSRYLFGRKYNGASSFTGSYYNDNMTAIASNNDYANINKNRVIDKAVKLLRGTLLPKLSSPLTLNADGTLTNEDITMIVADCEDTLRINMVDAGELSPIAPGDISINPTQVVNLTSTLTIAVLLNEIAIARNIVVPIKYK